MGSKERSRVYFDREAADYEHSADGRFVAPMYAEVLRQVRAAPGRSLLDVGCGPGSVLQLLADTELALWGIDLSEQMIAEARKRLGGRAQLAVGDAQQLPFAKGSMNMIVCNASFHHYPRPAAVLAEMARVLTPGGVLIMGETNPPLLLRLVLNPLLRFSHSGDYHLYSQRELQRLLEENGFTLTHWVKPNADTCVLTAHLRT